MSKSLTESAAEILSASLGGAMKEPMQGAMGGDDLGGESPSGQVGSVGAAAAAKTKEAPKPGQMGADGDKKAVSAAAPCGMCGETPCQCGTMSEARNTNKKTEGWFLHPKHGHMLRGPDYGDGWQTVVTSLVRNNIEIENDPDLWQKHVNRLHVNAGSGAVAADGMRVGDHNPEFKPISKDKVPPHIVKAFSDYVEPMSEEEELSEEEIDAYLDSLSEEELNELLETLSEEQLDETGLKSTTLQSAADKARNRAMRISRHTFASPEGAAYSRKAEKFETAAKAKREQEKEADTQRAVSRYVSPAMQRKLSSGKPPIPHAPASSPRKPPIPPLKRTVGEEVDLTEEEIQQAIEEARKKKVDAAMAKSSCMEDVDALFNGESLSEEFRTKASTIFEAAVRSRVDFVVQQIEEENNEIIEEEIEAVHDQLTEQVDEYLNYVVESWLQENQLAVETGLRTEIAEDFINGLKNLFVEHYIEVPEEKADLVEEMANRVAETETILEKMAEDMAYMQVALNESKSKEILRRACEGLTEMQVQKIKSLAEGVEFTTEGEYMDKLAVIRESYFPTKQVRSEAPTTVVETSEPAEVSNAMDYYVKAITKQLPK